MSEPKNTPTPWKILPEECDRPYIRIRGTRLGGRWKIANVLTPIYDGVGSREAEETRANAAFIVKACNSHDDLVKALKILLDSHGYTSYPSDEEREADPDIVFARAVLAKAGIVDR